MADKINLIPPTNLPTTEAENIDTLCVEDGRLKRRPGVHVGPPSWNDIKDKPESFGVSSWNDLEDKPFWENASYKTLVDEKTINFDDFTSNLRPSWHDANDVDLNEEYNFAQDSSSIGQPIRIVFDGVAHDTTTDLVGDYGDMYIGASFVHDGHIITVLLDSTYMINGDGLTGTHTFAMYKPLIETKHLDMKYLPEPLQCYETGLVVYDEHVIFGEPFSKPIPISNNEYIVYIDSTEWFGGGTIEGGEGILQLRSREHDGEFYLYDTYAGSSTREELMNGDHHIKVVLKYSVEVKQIDKKFIPGLPVCVKVYYDRNNNVYSCGYTEYDLEALMRTGVFMYAVIINKQNNVNGNADIDCGYFYCSHHLYPDDDLVYFTRPDGSARIIFSSMGTITVEYA